MKLLKCINVLHIIVHMTKLLVVAKERLAMLLLFAEMEEMAQQYLTRQSLQIAFEPPKSTTAGVAYF